MKRLSVRNKENPAQKHTPVLVVSLDFELLWGIMDHKDPMEYRENVIGGRKAIPLLLKLFETHGIHATWAAVGFQFAENSEELKQYIPEELPAYARTKLSPYPYLDNTDLIDRDPQCFFAPELIRMISETPGQEVASHTFSHYYCREKGQTVAQFRADMEAAERIASDHGYEVSSVVFPRNQTTDEYVSELAEVGIKAYRNEETDWIHTKVRNRKLLRLLRLCDVYLPLTGQGGYIPEAKHGVVDLTGSRMYKPYFKPLAFMEGLKIHRIKRQMLHAAKNGLTFHLWWHPHNIGVRTEFHMKQLEEIFRYYEELNRKYGMISLNMKEAAERVLNR